MAVAANIVIAFISLIAAIIYSGQTEFALQKINEIIQRKPGCNPTPSVGNVTLHYFAGRGRGEVIRMLMADADIPWTETRFTKETWPEAKQTGINVGFYTFGQVPAIATTRGHQLVQTLAILQFLARSAGYDCDCADLHWCQQIVLGVEDLTNKLLRVVYDKDFTLAKINEYLQTTLPTWLHYFEKIAPVQDKTGKELHFASERLTWVDFAVFNLIELNYSFEAATRDARGKEIDILENFPRLKIFYQEFQNRPKLHAYLNSNDRPQYKMPYSVIA